MVVQISGGIGNQLFQYYAGYCAAIKNNRTLILDDFRMKEGSYYSNRIKAEMQITGIRGLLGLRAEFSKDNTITRILSKNKISMNIPVYRRRILVKDFSPNGEIGTELTSDYLDFFDLSIPEIRVRGNLQSLQIAQEAIVFGAASTLEIPLVRDSVREILRQSAISKPIGIHLRLKDYFGSPQELVLGSKYYEDAIAHIKGLIPNSPLWLFTDDINLAMKLLPETIRFGISQVVDPKDFSDVETLLIMSRCEGLVIANSTFSFWAAFFQKSQIVVAPNPWFKAGLPATNDTEFNYPKSWKILSW